MDEGTPVGSKKYDFQEVEKFVAGFWKEHNIYSKCKEASKGGPQFKFLDGLIVTILLQI